MDVDNNKNNQKWFKKSWSYITGALLLSLVQIVTLIVTGLPWGITGAFAYWSQRLIDVFRGSAYKGALWFIENPVSLRNLGIIMGALLSALLASQFRLKKIKAHKQVVGAVIGGLLMGYGSSIASGCNIGAFYSAAASLSLSGWIFGFFLLLGAIIGGKLLMNFFI